MASNTQQTRYRRKLRDKKMGTKAKAARRIKGTTPVFPVHTAEADANAPHEAKPTS
jgi:hypothetical protein